MMATILSWLFGGGLKSIADNLQAAYQAKLNAANDADKIAADVRIQELQAQRDSILAAQHDRAERWVRIALAAPVVIYLWKVIVWDKVFGLGVTDPLSAMLTQTFWIVLGGYFVVGAAKIVRK